MGSQSVGVVTYVESGVPGRLGLKTKTRTVTPVGGVHFRPLSAREKKDVTDTAAQVWKLTADPHPALAGLRPDAELVYDGTESPAYPVNPLDGTVFHVIAGDLPKFDMEALHHVTVLAERQSG